jgi:hypothetical protein
MSRARKGTTVNDEPHRKPESIAIFQAASRGLVILERTVFVVVGLLLFAAAVALAWRSIVPLYDLFAAPDVSALAIAAHFLDIMLLILMIAEIAYTVTLSVRGAVLSPQPFLIVGLIAIIRRILVITVQDVRPTMVKSESWFSSSTLDVALLTLVVIAFVFAIYLLRKRSERVTEAVEE